MLKRTDRGSVTVETIIVAPAFGLFVMFIVLAGRVGTARLDVDAAASQAARTITRSSDPWRQGVAEAEAIARDTVNEGSPTCPKMEMVPTPGRVGTSESVAVRVTCRTDLSELTGLPIPGWVDVHSRTVTEVFDEWTEGGAGGGGEGLEP